MSSKAKNARKARLSVEVKTRWQIDDEKEKVLNYSGELIITTEQIEYVVQNIASAIVNMASRIATPPTVRKNGAHKSTSGNRTAKPSVEPVS
jgi:hypothetical protein